MRGRAAASDVGLGAAGAVIDAVALVVLACGVLATVESPEPQPVSVAAINTATDGPISGSARQGSDHTSRNRTVIGPAGAAGVAACRDPPRPPRLHSRSPLNFLDDDPPGQLARGVPCDLCRPADSSLGLAGDRRRRLRVTDGDPGGNDSAADGGFRRGGTGADRHRQDGGVRDPDPVQDRHHQQSDPSAGAGAHP